MSLPVAIQSVVFYVLACSSCRKMKTKWKNRSSQTNRRPTGEGIETEQPELYKQPLPYGTNPFWEEEIALGPHPPSKKSKAGSKNASSRAINTAGAGSSVASSAGISTDVGSSPTAVASEQRLSGDDWNRKRYYQREDEELWSDIPKVTQRIKEAYQKAEESVGSKLRQIEDRWTRTGSTKDEFFEESSPYYVARNPPVNDLHPPVVSSLGKNKSETAWMLQPPPSARVMEGKERANRSRSGSGTSSKQGTDGQSLSRQVTGRTVEERIRRGENPSDLELRLNGSRPGSRSNLPAGSTTTLKTQRKRSRSLQSVASSASSDAGIRRKNKSSPLQAMAGNKASKAYSVEHDPVDLDDKAVAPARPPLETIVSSSTIASEPRSIASQVLSAEEKAAANSKESEERGLESEKTTLGASKAQEPESIKPKMSETIQPPTIVVHG